MTQVSALDAAIKFDYVDMDYYKTQLVQLRHTGELLHTIKQQGINAVSKVQLDAYHDATWAMNMATATYECKTRGGPCCCPMMCYWHGYCNGCFACYSLDMSHRRGRLIYDRLDVKEFLRRQELRAQGFTVEQTLHIRDTAQRALDTGDGRQMMKAAEDLDLMDKQFSAGGAMMANMPHLAQMMGQMQMGGMQHMGQIQLQQVQQMQQHGGNMQMDR